MIEVREKINTAAHSDILCVIDKTPHHGLIGPYPGCWDSVNHHHFISYIDNFTW